MIEKIRGAKDDVAQQYSEIAQRYGNLQALMTHCSALAPLVQGRPLQSDTADAGCESTQ